MASYANRKEIKVMTNSLLTALKKCKPMHKEYAIKPSIDFYLDKRRYKLAFLPTVTYVPWIYTHPNSKGIIDIWWLNFHIALGTFERKGR